jgi:hypothetical protein
MARHILRRNRRLNRYLPRIIRAAVALAITFRRNRRTRWAIRLIPLIMLRVLARLARIRRITPRVIVTVISRETAYILANRRRAFIALRRAQMQRRRPRPGRGRRPRPRGRVRRIRPRYCVI